MLIILYYICYLFSYHHCIDSFQFCFKEWPLSSPNNCNPYDGHMDLICRVEGINLDIKWFYSTLPNAENSSIPLQNVTDQYFIQHDFVFVVNSSVHTATRSRLRVKNASSGYYWCRIYKNNVPLWPVSFKMDLSEPQYYSRYGSCTSNQADMINKCYYVAMPSAATSTTSVNPPGSTAAGVLQLQTTATQPSLLGFSTRHQRYTSSSYMPSSSVTGRLAAGVSNCNEYQLWLFVVIALTAIFAVIIVVLSVICVWLCVLKSRTTSIACVKGFSMQIDPFTRQHLALLH